MEDVLGYSGKRVVVTGAFSGMGEATASALVDLGATVIALDIKPTSVPVKEFIEVDLRDKASIDNALGQIGTPVDALFCCAGLPGAPFSDVDVMLVNFVGTRHLIESIAPTMTADGAIAWVASSAGVGWQGALPMLNEILDCEGFEAGRAWTETHPDAIAGGLAYLLSKQLINAYVASRAGRFFTNHQLRLNCSNPGPTATPMMPLFEEANGKQLIEAALGPIHRYSNAVEQAWPLIFLNSPRSSFVTGESFHVDGGFSGALTTGQIDFSQLFDES